MEEPWKILLYRTAQGGSPVKEFIDSTGKTFLLLHGFKKKKDKTPPNEIKTALSRLIDL